MPKQGKRKKETVKSALRALVQKPTRLMKLQLLLPALISLLTASFSELKSQCTLICSNSITVALDTAGEAEIYPPMLLQSSVGCSNNFEINIVDTLGNQQVVPLNASQLGMPLTATLLHPASGNSCDVAITVVDLMAPEITCTDSVFIWCNENTDSLQVPEVSDNVTETDSIEIVFTDVFTDFNCFEEINGQAVTAHIERKWYATDESGNIDSCTQQIYLKRAVLSQIVFPDHHDGVELPALECSVDDPNDLAVAGQPTVEGMPLDIAGSCELIVSHSDQEVPICGGARKVIRTWTVFDLCTEGFLVYAQIINVEDTTPPVLTCPDNVSYNTFSSSCNAQVWLPAGSASDECSGAIMTPSWEFGTGYGPFNIVPSGEHTVTYTAEDGCNNTATCQITVSVVDAKKPTALCEVEVQVSLEEDGTALVFAGTFDNGSYDNCGISEYLVKLEGTELYDEFVSFTCDDLDATPQVTLKVIDENGLESTCSSSVLVLDQIMPEVLCPAASTISCGVDFTDTNMTGLPFATDNCSIASTGHTDLIDLNNCGNGTVLRTWRATDQSGNISECQQEINIEDNTDITVTFPDDMETYECMPNLDVSITGEPVVTGQDCEQLQVTHTDYYFYTAEPACYQLIRNWAVVDWCSYEPNDPGAGGFWEHTQVIEVRDSVPPVLTCPDNMTVGIAGSGCETFVEIPLPGIDDCSNQLTVINDSEHAFNAAGAASGVYLKGSYNIVYTVSDGCGNTSDCSMSLTVFDSEAPNPVCNNGVSVTIQQNGYVTLTPANINNGSFDNCSPANTLVLQVSPNTFTCQDLGTKVVTLTVTDQSGNSSFCQTNVVVQDNLDVCGDGTVGTIAGKMETEMGEPLSQKLIGLTGGINMAVQSDVDGTFDFPSLPLNQSYTLRPSYNTGFLNGVTTYDLVLIRRHILDVALLDSPYKLIAADINASYSITTYDLVVLQKLILNIIDELPNNNTSWRFVPADYVFANPQNAQAENFPEEIVVNNLLGNVWEQDFIGIKVGDVNGSVDPTDFTGGGSDDRSLDKTLIFNTEDLKLVAGHEYAIPFVAASSHLLAGFQFTLAFDEKSIQFAGYEAGTLPALQDNNFGVKYAEQGMVAMNWENVVYQKTSAGEALFSLKFLAKKDARLSEVLALNSRLAPTEAYLSPGETSTLELEVADVALSFQTAVKDELQFFQNTPNPFFQTTNLNFFLPEATTVTFRIYNVAGQPIKTYAHNYTQGQHSVPIDLGHAAGSGIFICEMTAQGYPKQTIKLVISD